LAKFIAPKIDETQPKSVKNKKLKKSFLIIKYLCQKGVRWVSMLCVTMSHLVLQIRGESCVFGKKSALIKWPENCGVTTKVPKTKSALSVISDFQK